jgi:hypothetical protein
LSIVVVLCVAEAGRVDQPVTTDTARRDGAGLTPPAHVPITTAEEEGGLSRGDLMLADRRVWTSDSGHRCGVRVVGRALQLGEQPVQLGGGAQAAGLAAGDVQADVDESQQQLGVALVEQQQRHEVLRDDHGDGLSIMIPDL